MNECIMNIVYLIPLFPLIGFLINGLGQKTSVQTMIGIIGSGMMLASFVVSVWMFLQVKGGNTHVRNISISYQYGKLSIPFAFQVDQLSSIFLLIITGVGFLIHVYSTSYMHEEKRNILGDISPTSICLYFPCCCW